MIAFLVRLLRIVLVLLFVRLLVRGFASLVRGSQAPPAPGPRLGADADLVRDPVCQTFVPRSAALRATVGGRDEYFCGPACRDRARTALDSGAAAVQSRVLR